MKSWQNGERVSTTLSATTRLTGTSSNHGSSFLSSVNMPQPAQPCSN